MEEVKQSLSIFVDESGSIPHESDKNKYFIIGMLFTDAPEFLRKVFKRERLKIINKNPVLKKLIGASKELKGSEINETSKNPIYDTLIRKCQEHFEIAIIMLDLQTCDTRMRDNSSRTFNFLVKRYLETYFKEYSKFKDLDANKLIIDERNIKTGAKYTLAEYLNTELNLVSQFSQDEIKVNYVDSKNSLNLQLIDFISNTHYRYHQGNSKESEKNVELLKNLLCKSKEYIFPLS